MLPDPGSRLEEQKRRLRECRRRMRSLRPGPPGSEGAWRRYVLQTGRGSMGRAGGAGDGVRLLTAADCAAFLAELARRELHVSLWENGSGLGHRTDRP
jgi:hypothetical protein